MSISSKPVSNVLLIRPVKPSGKVEPSSTRGKRFKHHSIGLKKLGLLMFAEYPVVSYKSDKSVARIPCSE